MNDSPVSNPAAADAISAGDRLPAFELPNALDGSAIPLLRGRGPQLFVLTNEPDCLECNRFLNGLEECSPSLDEWGAHLVVIASGLGDAARALRSSVPSSFELLVDAEQRFERRTRLRPPALVVADEWGEVYAVYQTGAEHSFPAAAEVEDWLRFIAVQCPECEAPEGPWREL